MEGLLSMTVAIFATVIGVCAAYIGGMIMVLSNGRRGQWVGGMLLAFAMLCAMIMTFHLTGTYR